MSKRKLRGFDFERLEDRRLLAADCCVEVIQCCNMLPAETCMETTMHAEDGMLESGFEELDGVDVETPNETEIGSAALSDDSVEQSTDEAAQVPVVDPAASDELLSTTIETEVAKASEFDTQIAEDEATSEHETDVKSQTEAGALADADVESQNLFVSELRDPVTGTSGYFGEIDEVSPARTMAFTPTESGTVNVVIASSFGDSETRFEVVNSNGELIAETMTEDLNGFQRLTFDVVENETYEMTVSSDESGEGYFMLTVDFNSVVESPPVDLHVDQIGELATLLELQDGAVSVQGELETAEDCDAFRFVASADGEMVLSMEATSEDHKSNAIVSVFDPLGDLVVSGLTNEEVTIRFDAASGVEYQVLVDSQNDVPNSFAIDGTLLATETEKADPVDDLVPVVEAVLADESEAVTEDELAGCEVDIEATENGLVDEVFAELGDDLLAENDTVQSRFGGHRRGHWQRRT